MDSILTILKSMDIPGIIGLIVLIILGTTLVLWHRDDTPFDLKFILIDTKTNRVSLQKFGQLLALTISTIIILHETSKGRLTEWLFTGYMVSWAGANLLSQWIRRDEKKTNNTESSSNAVVE